MQQAWQIFLRQQLTNHHPLDATDNTIFNLGAEALFHIHGGDAEDFLQSQLSNDLRDITTDKGQLSCYCNPKGRIIALLRCYPAHDGGSIGNKPSGYYLLLPESVAETVHQRLSLYRMRANVTIDNTTKMVHFGAMGTLVSHWLEQHDLLPDVAAYSCIATAATQVVRIGIHRYDIMASPEHAIALWQELGTLCQIADTRYWRYINILAGLPCVHKHSSELFIPQMLNLDLLDAISFSKGCYPGQEIIARMHYLGRNRQRMLHYFSKVGAQISTGMAIYGNEKSLKVGTIVDAMDNADGSCQLLATIKLDYVDQTLHAGSAQGPELQPRSLPYTIPELQPQ